MIALAVALVSATPNDPAFEEQAKRCGITSDHIVWKKDPNGKPVAATTPNGDYENFSFQSFKCLLDWAHKYGRRVGFISEPPPNE